MRTGRPDRGTARFRQGVATHASWWPGSLASASGLLTVSAMLAAFALANTSFRPLYQLVHHTPVAFQIGPYAVVKPLILWINEGLMALFFLLISLEVKREVLQGHLASARGIALPAIAALGGMLVPAIVYLIVAGRVEGAGDGWVVPTATDTVLALSALYVLGRRVPAGVKAFLTALAIFDDLAAIAILAAMFTRHLSMQSLAVAGAAGLALIALNRSHVSRTSVYALVGIVFWAAVLESGVHATLAGFLLGLAVPLRHATDESSPLVTLEHSLRPWVMLVVVPIFAFFNSGIALFDPGSGTMSWTVVLAVAAALFVGKQSGVLAASWLAVRVGAARLPSFVSWHQIYGAAVLAGIGFTMSLFFAALAFRGSTELALSAKVGVLTGSLLSATVGIAVLALSGPSAGRAADTPSSGPSV